MNRRNPENDFMIFSEYMEKLAPLPAAGPEKTAETDFLSLCLNLDLDPEGLDEYLIENFGYSGDEILLSYFSCIPVTML